MPFFVTDAALKFVKEKNGENKENKKSLILYTQAKASKIRKSECTLHLKISTESVPIQQTLITLCAVLGKHQAFIPIILNILTVYSLTQHKPETLA